MAKQKILKKWNGRDGKGKGGKFYIAAYTQTQAAELYAKAVGFSRGALGEIMNYYSNCWGNAMNEINPTEPCVYHQPYWQDIPKKIV